MAATAPSLSPLRLLILSPAVQSTDIPSPFPPVLTHLTSVAPSEDIGSFAGYTSHAPLKLRTKYYSKDVSIWCDELPDPAKPQPTKEAEDAESENNDVASGDVNLEEWKTQMLSSAAAEVRAVIGGIILILPTERGHNSTFELMKYIRAAHAFREAIEDESPGRDLASILIIQPQIQPKLGRETTPESQKALIDAAEKLSNECIEDDMFGWDIVAWTGRADTIEADWSKTLERNEFGERTGMPRVIEVLEGIDWSAGPSADDNGMVGPNEDTDLLGRGGMHGLDHELQQEMLGLKLSILDNVDRPEDEDSGEDLSIEQMDSLKSRILAIRETVAGMPDAQKEAFAKREIDKIMKDL